MVAGITTNNTDDSNGKKNFGGGSSAAPQPNDVPVGIPITSTNIARAASSIPVSSSSASTQVTHDPIPTSTFADNLLGTSSGPKPIDFGNVLPGQTLNVKPGTPFTFSVNSGSKPTTSAAPFVGSGAGTISNQPATSSQVSPTTASPTSSSSTAPNDYASFGKLSTITPGANGLALVTTYVNGNALTTQTGVPYSEIIGMRDQAVDQAYGAYIGNKATIDSTLSAGPNGKELKLDVNNTYPVTGQIPTTFLNGQGSITTPSAPPVATPTFVSDSKTLTQYGLSKPTIILPTGWNVDSKQNLFVNGVAPTLDQIRQYTNALIQYSQTSEAYLQSLVNQNQAAKQTLPNWYQILENSNTPEAGILAGNLAATLGIVPQTFTTPAPSAPSEEAHVGEGAHYHLVPAGFDNKTGNFGLNFELHNATATNTPQVAPTTNFNNIQKSQTLPINAKIGQGEILYQNTPFETLQKYGLNFSPASFLFISPLYSNNGQQITNSQGNPYYYTLGQNGKQSVITGPTKIAVNLGVGPNTQPQGASSGLNSTSAISFGSQKPTTIAQLLGLTNPLLKTQQNIANGSVIPSLQSGVSATPYTGDVNNQRNLQDSLNPYLLNAYLQSVINTYSKPSSPGTFNTVYKGVYANPTELGARALQVGVNIPYILQNYIAALQRGVQSVPNTLLGTQFKPNIPYTNIPTGFNNYLANQLSPEIYNAIQNSLPTTNIPIVKNIFGEEKNILGTIGSVYPEAISYLGSPNQTPLGTLSNTALLTSPAINPGESQTFGIASGLLSQATGNDFGSGYKFGVETAPAFGFAGKLGDILGKAVPITLQGSKGAISMKDISSIANQLDKEVANGQITAEEALSAKLSLFPETRSAILNYLLRTAPTSSLFGGITAGNQYLQGNKEPINLATAFALGYGGGQAFQLLPTLANLGYYGTQAALFNKFPSLAEAIYKMPYAGELPQSEFPMFISQGGSLTAPKEYVSPKEIINPDGTITTKPGYYKNFAISTPRSARQISFDLAAGARNPYGGNLENEALYKQLSEVEKRPQAFAAHLAPYDRGNKALYKNLVNQGSFQVLPELATSGNAPYAVEAKIDANGKPYFEIYDEGSGTRTGRSRGFYVSQPIPIRELNGKLGVRNVAYNYAYGSPESSGEKILEGNGGKGIAIISPISKGLGGSTYLNPDQFMIQTGARTTDVDFYDKYEAYATNHGLNAYPRENVRGYGENQGMQPPNQIQSYEPGTKSFAFLRNKAESPFSGIPLLEKAFAPYRTLYTAYSNPEATLLSQTELNAKAPYVRREGRVILDTPKGIVLVKESNGEYGLPGGGVNRDETTQTAAAREVQEELGVTPQNLQSQFSYSGKVKPLFGTGAPFQPQLDVYSAKIKGNPTIQSKELSGLIYWKPGSNVKLGEDTKSILEKYLGISTPEESAISPIEEITAGPNLPRFEASSEGLPIKSTSELPEVSESIPSIISSSKPSLSRPISKSIAPSSIFESSSSVPEGSSQSISPSITSSISNSPENEISSILSSPSPSLSFSEPPSVTSSSSSPSEPPTKKLLPSEYLLPKPEGPKYREILTEPTVGVGEYRPSIEVGLGFAPEGTALPSASLLGLGIRPAVSTLSKADIESLQSQGIQVPGAITTPNTSGIRNTANVAIDPLSSLVLQQYANSLGTTPNGIVNTLPSSLRLLLNSLPADQGQALEQAFLESRYNLSNNNILSQSPSAAISGLPENTRLSSPTDIQGLLSKAASTTTDVSVPITANREAPLFSPIFANNPATGSLYGSITQLYQIGALSTEQYWSLVRSLMEQVSGGGTENIPANPSQIPFVPNQRKIVALAGG